MTDKIVHLQKKVNIAQKQDFATLQLSTVDFINSLSLLHSDSSCSWLNPGIIH